MLENRPIEHNFEVTSVPITVNHDIHVALNSCSFSFKITLGKVV